MVLGGLEVAFYLRTRLHDRAYITLASGQDHFLFKLKTIYIPFGLDPERLKNSPGSAEATQAHRVHPWRGEEIDPVVPHASFETRGRLTEVAGNRTQT